MSTFVSILQLGSPKRCFYGAGQSTIWLLRKKEKVVDTLHELINKNHSHSNYVIVEFKNSSSHDFYQTSQKE